MADSWNDSLLAATDATDDDPATEAADDSITGGADDGDTGDTGDDSLDGSGNDSLDGSSDSADQDAGDDSLDGSGDGDTDTDTDSDEGDDSLAGGDDTDSDTDDDNVSGSVDDFVVTHTDAGISVSSKADPAMSMNLQNADRVHFSDATVAFDIQGHAGEAYRLYKAAFDRAPDPAGLGYQIHDLDTTASLEQVAANFIASPEFQSLYGSVDDAQFIDLLYQNVLGRSADAGGLQFHLDEFANGESRAQMLLHFSESPENQANVIGQIDHGIVFTG